jgi:hypothetical protein
MTRTIAVGQRQGRGDPCIRATAMHRIPELQTEEAGEPMAEPTSDAAGDWLLFILVSVVFALITLIAAVTAYPNLR